MDREAVEVFAQRRAGEAAADDLHLVPGGGEPSGEDLDEALDPAHVGPEVRADEEHAHARDPSLAARRGATTETATATL